MGRYQRRKGADSERALANWFRLNGYRDARRTFAGDGRQAGDIDGIGVHIEVKAHERPRIVPWLRQVERERGDRPGYLVWHVPGKGNPGEWAVYWESPNGIIRQSTVRELWAERGNDATIGYDGSEVRPH